MNSDRLFVVGEDQPAGSSPGWLADSLSRFREEVGSRDYPCYFGHRALRDGELFVTWVDHGESVSALAADLTEFLDATRPFPKKRMVLAAFFAPEPGHDHEWYGDRFWSVLRDLRELDTRPRPAVYPESPQDPRWEFTFGGEAMFVFAAAPTHVERRSRRLGPGLVMLFQPRNVFHGIEGGTPGGTSARRRIRAKLGAWDAARPHPVMGHYGDAANFEWKQYYIADHERSLEARCPLDPAAELPVHELVAEQARRTPDALAVVAGDRTLDYRTLERSANELAARLVAKGIRPEARLAIMADRSVDTVVSMLAILKAGASYLPLDPNYPEDRRAYLLDDAGVDIVLTPRRLVSTVPVGPRWLLLSDDSPRDGVASPAQPPETTVRPDNLAYVIYTSGSTGTPKGVAISHRQIAHSTSAQYAVERPWPEAFLMPISFSFDASAVGIYWTLTVGGCVVLPADGEHGDPDRLRALIARYGVTHIDCTPSLYDLILGDDAADVATLRCVQVGGEACPSHLVARHRELLPECVFENNYGPTEATIWSTTYLVDPDGTVPDGTVPIGHPIPGARVYLLDESLRRVARGEHGDVYVGGAGVARGYLNRPALTAERFLPDPFSGRAGARMYRTGDIARELDGGALDFAGRADTQVKVRGYRIELGEIEVALRSHPDVAEAVVVARAIAGSPTLVGYVRPQRTRVCTDKAMVSYLSSRLPDHMVPRRYVVVDRMPRTISGKIDYPRLPDPATPPPDVARLAVTGGAAR